MTPETLTCAANITPDQLSALRDDALPMAEAQRLRAHISGCPACQARLADYDTLTAALRQQRELEPGERIVEGVRARLTAATTPQRRLRHKLRPSRRLWAGLATLAPVAAIILLFVYVFGGLAGHNRPAANKTPTITPLGGKHLSPTATPAIVTLPPMTPAISAQAAWGTLAPMESFTTPATTGTQYTVGVLSPDASTLVGTEMPISATPGAVGIPRVDLVSYDFASHTWKPLGPHWNGYVGPWGGALAVSGRYIVYSFNSQPGATCGLCHNTLWAYDRQTGASWEFDPGKQYEGDQGDAVSGDHVAFTTMEGQVWIADLAAHQVTLALPPHAQPLTANSSPTSQPFVRLDGFTWPYLIYEYSPPPPTPTTPVATTLRILNLQTQTITILPQPIDSLFQFQQGAGSSSSIQSVYIGGDTLYAVVNTNVDGVSPAGQAINVSYGTLYRISHVFSGADGGANGQPAMLARWLPQQQTVGSARGMNARLILLDGGYAWDIVEGRLAQVDLPAATTPSGASEIGPGMSLSGNYLLVTSGGAPFDNQTSSASMSGAVYDTTTLPIR